MGFQRGETGRAGRKKSGMTLSGDGLCALKAAGFPEDGIVLIHDGAETACGRGDHCARSGWRLQLFCLRGSDAGKGYDQSGGRGRIFRSTPDRSTLWQIQTPQAFRFELIYRAYEKIFAPGADRSHITDDAMVVELMTDTRGKNSWKAAILILK